jgi:hypothetical protein
MVLCGIVLRRDIYRHDAPLAVPPSPLLRQGGSGELLWLLKPLTETHNANSQGIQNRTVRQP